MSLSGWNGQQSGCLNVNPAQGCPLCEQSETLAHVHLSHARTPHRAPTPATPHPSPRCAAHPRRARHPSLRPVAWAGDVRFERCEFAQLDLIALALDRGAQRTLVSDCLFRDVGGAAYQLGRWDSADEADASRQERDNTLRDSILADVGAEYRGAAAVQVGHAPPTQPEPAPGP